VNDALHTVSLSVPQEPSGSHAADYAVIAANFQPIFSRRLNCFGGRTLGSADFFVSCLDLHLTALWERDAHGRERIGLPRRFIADRGGRLRGRTLVRWHTAQAAQRVERCARVALHELLATRVSR